jgi:hypothetical protein
MGKRGLVGRRALTDSRDGFGRRSFLRLAGTGLAGGAAALLDPALAGASPGLTVRGGDADGGATVAGAPISHAKVVVPMVFPVLGGASYTDSFLACRGTGCSRQHLGQDLMAPKLRMLVATFDGVITYLKAEGAGSSGNYLCLRSDDGWTTNYLHINNDTPGTDDGRGTASWGFFPGIRQGARVFAGQRLAWLGDSGNAETTAPHCHFELRKGDAWSGTVYNAKPSLDKATRLTAARVGGPHPDGTIVQAGAGWTLWLLEGGKRRRLLPSVFAANGYRQADVIRVQPGEVNSYPGGTTVPLRDGLVVRGPDNRCWVIAGGQRIAVTSAAAAASIGVDSTRLRRVDEAALHLTPLAADQTLPGKVRPGALLRVTGGSAVWLVTADGRRRWVPDAVTLASWGWTRGDVIDVSQAELDTLAEGPVLPVREGTMLRAPAGSYWIATGGRRRLLPSRQVMDAFGWKTTSARTVDAKVMARLPEGPRLP